MIRVAIQHFEQLLLAVEYLGTAGKDIVLKSTFDTSEFQHRTEFR